MLSSHKSWFVRMLVEGYLYWIPVRPSQALILKGLGVPILYGSLRDAIRKEYR